MIDGSSRVGASEDRGASNVVGLAILFGMVFLGATLVFLAGGMAVEELKQGNEARSAEMSMQEVRSDISSLSARGEGSTELQVDDDVSIVADGEMSFTVKGWTDDATYRRDCTTELPLSAFQYENDDGERVAYQGGGVWKRTDGGSTMVSPPALSYRTEEIEGEEYRTFDFSVENLTGRIDGEGETTASVNRTRSLERQATIEREMFCRDDADANVTRVRSLEIRVENSTYYDAWGRFFASQMGDAGDVHVFDANRTVVVRDLPLGRTDLSLGNGVPLLEATPNTNESSAHHRLRYRVGEELAGEDLNEIEIAYQEGDTDLTRLDTGNANSRIKRSEVRRTNASNEDLSPDSIGVSGDTVTVGFDGSVTLEENDVVVVEYGSQGNDPSSSKIENPSSPGAYNVTASVNGEDRPGQLLILTDAISDSPYADADSDGVPDYADECEGVSGDGANGCGVVSVDEDANALRVNSSSGTIELVGTQIAEERTINETVAERRPLDVMFVLDRSGSMGRHYRAERKHRDEVDWADSGGNYYQVPSETVVEAYNRQYGPGSWIRISGNRQLTVYERHPGYDPDGKRVDATRSFVGALNASAGDRAGAVEFNLDDHRRHDLTDRFDSLNASITDTADGGTNITAGLVSGLDELERHGTNEAQVVVLLSDGANNVPEMTRAEADEMTRDAAERAAADDVTVYTIGLGEGADEDLLRDVADETGGEYHYVDDAENLEEIFDQIAGEETRKRSRAVEHKTVRASVQIGGDTYALDPSAADGPVAPDGSASAINDPTDDRSLAFAVDGIDAGSLVSFSARSVDCSGATDTGLESDHGGETYAHTTCNGTTGTIDSADNGSESDHRIFRDGDDLPTLSTAWWQPDFEDVLDDDLHGGGEFDLGEDQAIILVELDGANGGHTDYAVFLYDADAGDRSYGDSGDDYDSDSDNRYVIDISPTQVEIGDD